MRHNDERVWDQDKKDETIKPKKPRDLSSGTPYHAPVSHETMPEIDVFRFYCKESILFREAQGVLVKRLDPIQRDVLREVCKELIQEFKNGNRGSKDGEREAIQAEDTREGCLTNLSDVLGLPK